MSANRAINNSFRSPRLSLSTVLLSLGLVKTAEHQEDPVTDQTDRMLTLEESATILGTGVRFTRRLIAERRTPVREGREARARSRNERYATTSTPLLFIPRGPLADHREKPCRADRSGTSASCRPADSRPPTSRRAEYGGPRRPPSAPRQCRGVAHARPGQHPGRPLARSRACPPAGHGLCADLDRAAAFGRGPLICIAGC